MFRLVKEFEFSAAHYLTKYKGKCENLHGHNYKFTVTVTGKLTAEDIVIDFGDLKQLVQHHILSTLDHTNLNDRFPNPSCEIITQWIFRTIQAELPATVTLQQVQLWETPTSSIIYNGNLS